MNLECVQFFSDPPNKSERPGIGKLDVVCFLHTFTLKIAVALAVELAERPSYIFLPNSNPIHAIHSLLPSPFSIQLCLHTMAGENPDSTLCWITFYGLPIRANKEALAAQLVDTFGGDKMRVVRTGISEIQVMAMVRDPCTTVPTVCNVVIGDRMHPITIDVIDANLMMQRESRVLQQAHDALAKYRDFKAKQGASE